MIYQRCDQNVAYECLLTTVRSKTYIYVAVPGRNWTWVFWSHCRVRSAETQFFRYGWGSYALCKLMNTWSIYTARMCPAFNRSFALQHFEHSNAIEIHNRISTRGCHIIYVCIFRWIWFNCMWPLSSCVAVCAVLVVPKDLSPDHPLHAAGQPWVSAPHRILHLQARVWVIVLHMTSRHHQVLHFQ